MDMMVVSVQMIEMRTTHDAAVGYDDGFVEV